MGADRGASDYAGAALAAGSATRRFRTLDGMRGVAALVVVVWHAHGERVFASGYLAVDLFFVISGFVIAFRYDSRLSVPGHVLQFGVMRAVRLYPLYILGSGIGAVLALGRVVLDGPGMGALAEWSAKLIAAIVMAPLILPNSMVFPFNVPAWSLFYEYLVNIVYAVLDPWSTARRLTIIVAVSAAALVGATLWAGTMRFTGAMPYFLLGSVRAVFGFSAGLLIHRVYKNDRFPRVVVPVLLLLGLVIAGMLVPQDDALGLNLTLITVLLLFPLLVAVGITNEPSGITETVCRRLGDLSYPLYAVHFPVLVGMRFLTARLHVAPLLGNFGGVVLSLLAAWVALVAFDIPLGRKLTASARSRWFQASSNEQCARLNGEQAMEVTQQHHRI